MITVELSEACFTSINFGKRMECFGELTAVSIDHEPRIPCAHIPIPKSIYLLAWTNMDYVWPDGKVGPCYCYVKEEIE